MPTLTKALGQWQLPLADGFRVRTRVPGVWGSIPSQVDPITECLAMDDLLRQNIMKIRDGNSQLFQQFLYGCHDDTLIMKLRLEEKQDYPDYGALLLVICKEEAKRTR